MASRRPLVKAFAEKAVPLAEGLRIVDYCLCLKGGYVVVEGPKGKALGFAHIPHEDLHDLGEVRRPRLEEMPEFVTDLNPLNRVLGVAMMNAVSQYHLDATPGLVDPYLEEEPICLVGNMGPLAEKLRREGKEVWVFERSRELRWRAYSDVEEELLLPRCRTLVITGMTLLNFTLDRVLELSQGLNILTGPTAGVHPALVKGSRVHVGYDDGLGFVAHGAGGYLAQTYATTRWIGLRPRDTYFCTVLPGWITGITYVLFGPFMVGSAVVIYEGGPDYPSWDVWWSVLEDYAVNVFLTTAGALRLLSRQDPKLLESHNLDMLKLILTTA
ncbi:MAG: DUF364 domain-containing protein, partial [Pyrobaculum sp.]